ncbi:MAG: FAD-binding oxidoreductase [Pyrinomonadaceae bacterium]|nr:FAD-binding oxidoreductase [Pyrinomonadaceae bacterium]
MDNLVEKLRAIVGRGAVLSEPSELIVYECDGLPQHKYPPRAVVFPSSTEQTAEVMRALADAGVPFTPRGAGTGLSGGALALDRGVVIELARMRKVLSIDEGNRTVVVQTGVVNAHVSKAVAHLGLHYVPDPSSQGTCTIGGNIAENAGGIHCLKYGTTTDHVIGARVVLAGGEIVDLRSSTTGYDLLGVFVGSEGTFGIATEATLRLVPVPPAVRTLLAEFPEVNDASHAVSAIIAAGVMPAALEMMDGEIIRAVEASVFTAGLSLDIGAALLVELDGIEAGIDDEAERVKSICLEYRARSCRLARDETERKKLWAARKGAFGAVGRIAPDSMIQDAVVPRSRLPEVLAAIYGIASKYDLRLANVFHAGDGNLHPFICFDSRSPEQVRRVKEAGRELMETCVNAGGTITGEHGVGLDKRDYLPLIFSDDDMDTMLRVRAAFDPTRLCNPGKIIPMLRGCGEARILSEPRAEATGPLHGAESTLKPRGGASLKEVDAPERHSLSALVGGKAAESGRQPFDPDYATKHLSAIVGEANISASPHLPVSPSPSRSVPASLSVTPGSIAEACEVMKLASREGWSIVPAGASTWLNAGNPIERVNIVISTARLNQFLDHEPADLVASAQAGVTLTDFNETLARGGQWLPLDPPDNGRATLGGVVATGLAGVQRCGYGMPRNFVIGMRVVLPDGKLVKAGGRVVKNVAGYDLCKLFTGSYGTLGLIAELTFKLRPRPAKEVTVLATGSFEAILRVVQSVHEARLFPVAVELVSSALGHQLGIETTAGDVLLLARFAGIAKTVSYQLEEATALIRDAGEFASIEIESNDRDLWRRLAASATKLDEILSWRAGVQPMQVGEFIKIVKDTYPDSFSESFWHAGIADGCVRMMEELDADTAEHSRRLKLLRMIAESFGGSLIIESGTEAMKLAMDAWGNRRSADLTKRIKAELDPQNLFSPGRLSCIE